MLDSAPFGERGQSLALTVESTLLRLVSKISPDGLTFGKADHL